MARQLHWLSAILAVVTIALAWGISGAAEQDGSRRLLIMLHGSFGIAILALMLFWLGWRVRYPPPALHPLVPRIEVLVARATQAAIFLLFVAMPLTGYLSLAAGGHAVGLFGVVAIPPLVPESGRLAQAAIALHLLGEFLIYGVVGLHIAAALMHGFIRRDGILEWMLPRRRA